MIIDTVEIKHDRCYEEIMYDVQLGYRCMVCGLFIHKKSNVLKTQDKKQGAECE